MKRLIVSLAALIAAPALAQSLKVDGVDGRWEGKVVANGREITTILRIVTDEAGTRAVMDSPDQNAAVDIPITALARSGAKVTYDIPVASLHFEGQLSADGKTLTGAMQQPGATMPVTYTRTATTADVAKPKLTRIEGLDGRWAGSINAGGLLVPVIMRISTDAAGTRAVMDSPGENVTDIPTKDLSRKGDSIAFAVPMIGGRFTGELALDGKSMTGAWWQGGQNMPLTLNKQ